MNQIYVEGLPWIPENGRIKLRSESLQSKILCEKHNRMLSRYDNEAKKLVTFLMPNQTVESNSINGNLIEKWILKVFVGLSESGNLRKDGKAIRFSKGAIDGIFSDAIFSEPFGLYFVGNDKNNPAVKAIEYMAKGVDGVVSLLKISIFKLEFVLKFSEGLSEDEETYLLKNANLYRPASITMTRREKLSRLDINWVPRGYGNIQIKAEPSTPPHS